MRVTINREKEGDLCGDRIRRVWIWQWFGEFGCVINRNRTTYTHCVNVLPKALILYYNCVRCNH